MEGNAGKMEGGEIERENNQRRGERNCKRKQRRD